MLAYSSQFNQDFKKDLEPMHYKDRESDMEFNGGGNGSFVNTKGTKIDGGNGSLVNTKATKILYQAPFSSFQNSETGFRRTKQRYLSIAHFSTRSVSIPSGGSSRNQPTWTPHQSAIEVIRPASSSATINEFEYLRTKLQELRKWEYTTFGKLVGVGDKGKDSEALIGSGTRFTLLNYNILAQVHLENHRNLYNGCMAEALEWRERIHLLLRDVDEFSPDLICFQEVEASEFYSTFTPVLDHSGYRGVFKKRSRDKPDGCAVFWSKHMFSLVGTLGVDLYQPHIPLLDRDNIALMVKLESKIDRTHQRLVVATTHLLFNPKRTDVKLGQVQFLLAELDRFAFSGFGQEGENIYHPLLLCGDFNTEPYSSIANLLTEGRLRYLDENGDPPKLLEKRGMVEFLPAYFGINDQCQHYQIQLERVKQWKVHRKNRFDLDRRTQLALINLYVSHTEPSSSDSTAPHCYVGNDSPSTSTNSTTVEESLNLSTELDFLTHARTMDAIAKFGLNCTFGSGSLSHGLRLRNVYGPRLDREGNNENIATTKQSAWTCADFIFQGMQWSHSEGRCVEGNLKLIRRLGLLTRNQCKDLGPLPNLASPSDHYPLLAEFLLK